MNTHHIFLLTPSDPSDQNHRPILIWTDNEKSARENTYSLFPDMHKGALAEESMLDEQSFYQNSKKVTCRELEEETDYKFVSGSDNELIIEYQNKRYTLQKDEPQIE